MSFSANYPPFRPSLNLNFARAKVLDPRITFTRASSATYYDGVTTVKAEENLLLRSQDYSATWTVTNLTPVTGKTAPDSTSTATEFTATAANAVLTQGYTAIAGSYTFSVFLRRVTGSGDIQIAADNGTWTTKVITGTWARYDVTQTVAAGSKTAGVRVVTDTDAIEVWGAQLEQRDSVTSYTSTTTQPITNYIPVLLTAANNVPRFDHNPTTNESLGLLIEESRTNLLTYSDDFANAAWGKTRSSITSNTIVAPDGTLTGDKLVEDTTASNTHQAQNSVGAGSVTPYSFSVYMKAGESARGSLVLVNATGGSASFNGFDLSSGTLIGSTSVSLFTAASASIAAAGNGWYRCTLTATPNDTSTLSVAIRLTDGSSVIYTGDGYSGIYIWGAQLEAAAFPTSYIATGAASATRSTDAASMIGPNFSSWYNAAEGTLYAEYLIPDIKQNQGAVAISDGTLNNRMIIRGGNSGLQTIFIGSVAAVAAWNASLNGAPVNSTTKSAFAYATNNIAWVRSAGTVGTDTSADIPVVDQLRLGADGNGSLILNGYLRRIAYYPLRLTNAQLQALTS